MMPLSPDSERRHFPRWDLNNRLLYHFENNSDGHIGCLKNLSTAGASVYIEKPLEIGQKLKLTIRLSEIRIVTVEARAMWIQHAKNGFLIGVDFDNVTEQNRQLILDHAFELNRQQLVNHWFQGWSS